MEDRRLYGLCSKQLCQKHRASVGYPPDGGIYLLPGSVSYTVTVPGVRYDSIADETLYDFNEVYSSGMVSLLNKMNAIYQLFGKPVFFLALLALLVLTVRVIHGLFHGDRTDLELWILSCGILLRAVLLRFGCGLFTGWFTDDMHKFINSFYSCGVYILLQLFKYLAIGTIYEGGITYGKFEGTDSGIAKDHRYLR